MAITNAITKHEVTSMALLKCERNTKTMGKRILAAARKAGLSNHPRRDLNATFEHGQWWIIDQRSGAQFAVCDAEGGFGIDGFDFERVTR